jgi:dCMP deaminase
LLSQKDKTFLEITNKLAELGTCPRKAVGALIVRQGRCISWGYNGAPPGLPHCSENKHGWLDLVYQQSDIRPGSDMDTAELRQLWIDQAVRREGCRNATHAEANALAFAARQGISTEGGTLYVSVSPCDVCSRLLIAAGIVRVVAHEAYRDLTPLEMLRRAGIEAIIYDYDYHTLDTAATEILHQGIPGPPHSPGEILPG